MNWLDGSLCFTLGAVAALGPVDLSGRNPVPAPGEPDQLAAEGIIQAGLRNASLCRDLDSLSRQADTLADAVIEDLGQCSLPSTERLLCAACSLLTMAGELLGSAVQDLTDSTIGPVAMPADIQPCGLTDEEG